MVGPEIHRYAVSDHAGLGIVITADNELLYKCHSHRQPTDVFYKIDKIYRSHSNRIKLLFRKPVSYSNLVENFSPKVDGENCRFSSFSVT